MVLSLKEERFYQKQVKNGLGALGEEGLTLKEERTAQKQVNEGLKKLGGEGLDEPKASATPLYDQLVAGDFNGFTHEKFADMCGRIVDEENKTWKDLRQPIIGYVEENEPYGGYNNDAFVSAA